MNELLKVITENIKLKARILELEDEVQGYDETLSRVYPIVHDHHAGLVDEITKFLVEKADGE